MRFLVLPFQNSGENLLQEHWTIKIQCSKSLCFGTIKYVQIKQDTCIKWIIEILGFTVSKFRRESTALEFLSLSSLFISRLYLVLHSVTQIVTAIQQTQPNWLMSPKLWLVYTENYLSPARFIFAHMVIHVVGKFTTGKIFLFTVIMLKEKNIVSGQIY